MSIYNYKAIQRRDLPSLELNGGVAVPIVGSGLYILRALDSNAVCSFLTGGPAYPGFPIRIARMGKAARSTSLITVDSDRIPILLDAIVYQDQSVAMVPWQDRVGIMEGILEGLRGYFGSRVIIQKSVDRSFVMAFDDVLKNNGCGLLIHSNGDLVNYICEI